MPNNTVNINNSIGDEPSKEYLLKFSKDKREQIKINFKKAKSVKEEKLSLLEAEKEKLNKLKSQENEIRLQELQTREQQVKDALEAYSANFPSPVIEETENGQTFKHKNKLGYIFIGDTEKAVFAKKDGKSVNSPKISMVVGGGLEAAYVKEPLKINPTQEKILGISAELSLISMYDLDIKGIGPNENVSFLKNRSVVKAKADALELSAKEIVVIRSLGEAYLSQGDRLLSPGGVHVISGMNTETKKITSPEPMVLGKKLSDTLVDMVDKMSELNSEIIKISEDIMNLKTFLMAHIHISNAPGLPTSPSAELISSLLSTIPSKSIPTITNSYTRIVNLEMLKTNRLMALSKESFMSQYNRVN